jgi:hypothetical protein
MSKTRKSAALARLVTGALVVGIGWAAAPAARAAGCDSDRECKSGRACVAHRCVRANACEKDLDCPGSLVCERAQCVAPPPAAEPEPAPAPSATPVSQPTVTPAPEAPDDPFPRRVVDQPVHLPSGMVAIDSWLKLIADSSGSSEVTFGQWLNDEVSAGISIGDWELWSSLQLKLAYPRDAPTWWSSSFEVDRALDPDLVVGVGVDVDFPTESYASYDTFVGAAWKRHLNDDNVMILRPMLAYIDRYEAAHVYRLLVGVEWDHQITDGLALVCYLRPYLEGGDSSSVSATATVALDYWTEDRWFIGGAFFASPDQGAFDFGIGRVF